MRVSNRGSRALIGAGLVGVALAASAQAAQPESADDTATEELAEIVVTGSRIATSIGMETPTPVTAITADELDVLSPSTLISALSQLPQFYGNTNNDTRSSFFNSPGAGNLNLRGLNTGGSGRTLTLLDGRRVVPGNGYGSVDINLLPSTLLKRVDTVTGGASAAYGTDAVAGAVNFILDTKYNGWQLNAQAGSTSRNDRGNMEYSAAWGIPIGNRMHLLASAEYYKAERVDSFADRGWYQGYALINNPAANTLTTPGYYQPTYIPRTNVVSSIATTGGLICGSSSLACSVPTTSVLYRRFFQPDGTLAPFVLGEGASPATSSGAYGAHSITGGGSGDDTTADLLDLAPKARRGSAFLYLDYDVTDGLNLYVQGLAGQSTINQRDHGGRFAAVSGIDTRITIYRENAFLPAEVRQIMVDEGLTSFQMNLIGDRAGLGRESRLKQDNKTYSGTLGFKWDIAQSGPLAGWQLNGYGQYGTADNRGDQQGLVIDHFLAAVDAIPDPNNAANTVCRAATINPTLYGDCVPLNLFGNGNASDAAIAYATRFTAGQRITTPLYYQPDGFDSGKTVTYTSGYGKVYNTRTKQTVGDVSASGKVIEGWAGPIAAALGVSYRKEQIDQIVYDPSNPTSDPALLPASAAVNPALRGVPSYFATRSSMIQNSTVANVHGSYDVKEAFTELQVPLLTGMPAAEQLNLLAAARIADYEGSGSVWSWKYGLDWQATSALRMRGTVSRDVRAATLLERFNQTGGIGSVEDPWQLTPGGTPTTHGISTRSGGNPELDPETSKTYTVGFVLEPAILPGFSTSVDYWKVDIGGAIGTLGTQRIVRDCFNSNKTASVCNLITFDSSGFVAQVRNITQNIAAAAGRGIDIEMGYRTPVSLFRDGGESMAVRVFWSHLKENATQTDRANPTTYLDVAGQVGVGSLPTDAVTATLSYRAGGFSLGLSSRYIGDGYYNKSYNQPLRRPDVLDNTIGSVTYFNLEGGYSWDMSGGKAELFANVQNLLDRDPPMIAQPFDVALGQTGTGGTNAGLYDMLGRRFTIGVRFRH